MSPRVVLVGAPGSGKTTVGRLLADAWACEFRDTDADIEQLAGSSISEIFIAKGEQAFRDLETQALAQALVECTGVLSLGGGVVLREENRRLLDGEPVVWLKVSLADAVHRVGLATSRPVLVGNVRGRMMQLLDERAPMYAEVARWTVDTYQQEPTDVVATITALVERADV